MASPLGDQADSKFPDSIYQSIRSHFSDDLAAHLDIQQLFILVDGVLPFEACLYYQVLPLYVDSNRLTLGMVNPNDSVAMDYVRRIISYHNYRPVAHTISSEALQAVLSAYLNYNGRQTKQPAEPGLSSGTRSPRGSARVRTKQRVDRNAQPTYIVDSPEDLNLELPEGFLAALPPGTSALTPSLSPSERPTLPITEVPENNSPPAPIAQPLDSTPLDSFDDSLNLHLSASNQPIDLEASLLEVRGAQNRLFKTQPLARPEAEEVQSPASSPAATEAAEVGSEFLPTELPPVPEVSPVLLQPIPALDVTLNCLNQPVANLAQLPPPEFLKELLGRVLVSGIGRLYFERQAHYGRVLWSQNGVLQAVLERLDLQQFQAIINELKRLAHLSLLPVTQSKQVETERLYERTRVLLRFRFIPTESGEEATIQILRGAALKFYQQQQVVSLERDALKIARQLQTKLNEIRDRARSESGAAAMKLEALPALSQILKSIEEQVQHMQPQTELPPLD